MSSTRRVEPGEAGERVDRLLCGWLGLSRREAVRLLERGGVRLNGRALRARDKGRLIEAGDVVEADPPPPAEEQVVVAEPELPLTVVVRGPGWVVVNKPAGMPVHPLRLGGRGTVLNALVAREPGVQGVGEAGLRSGVVHRLDVETSGALLFAVEQAAWERLRGAFRRRAIEKRYLAIVRGRVTGGGEEAMVLTVAQHRPAKVRVVEPGRDRPRQVRRCTLSWRAVETFGGASLVEVDLGTGFLHQIRAMFAHLGHPLVGDALYGGAGGGVEAGRPMLHAAELRFEEVRARCEPPGDFVGVLGRLRGGR